MKPIRRLLIYRFGQIGDTLAALPSLWLLRGWFKDARFTLLSEIPQSGIHHPPELVLPRDGLIQEFMKYRGGLSRTRPWSLAGTIMAVRRGRFDAVAYLAPSIRSPRQRKRDFLFFRLAGIRTSFGFKGFPDDPYPRSLDGSLAPGLCEADALLQRLALDGLPPVPRGAGSMEMLLTEAELARVANWWDEQRGVARTARGWFAVCTGSKWSSKKWPLERFLAVGRRLVAEQGLLPVVVGGQEDREDARRLIAEWGSGLCAAGDLSVRESAALLRGAAFYLGNDTGAMHLAAAVGRPCVAIFSSVDWPGRWSPYGPGHRVLRFDVPCAGCLLEICNHRHECLAGIEVDEVHRACIEVLDSARKPAGASGSGAPAAFARGPRAAPLLGSCHSSARNSSFEPRGFHPTDRTMNENEKLPAGFKNPTALPDERQNEEWQRQNAAWWQKHPMRYDWGDEIPAPEFSREFYEEIDRRHFDDASRYMPPRDRPFDEIAPFADLPAMDVLEIGVGNGSHAQLLAPRCRSYTGIDLTEYAVSSTRKRFEIFNLKGDIRRMDAEHLEFPDGSFDFIWTWGVIHHSADTGRILAEMHRVLRPGGRATVMVYHRSFLYFYVFTGLFRGILGGGFLRTRSLHELVQLHTDGAIARFYRPNEWRKLVESNGFTVEDLRIRGQKSEIFPLPPSRFKATLMNLTPSGVSRFILNTCRQGSFLITMLRKRS